MTGISLEFRDAVGEIICWWGEDPLHDVHWLLLLKRQLRLNWVLQLMLLLQVSLVLILLLFHLLLLKLLK